MKNGTQPQKLLEKIRRSGKCILTRSELMDLSKGISHPDRVIAKLAKAELVEKLSRGVWLVPTGQRPKFDIPRFWSNPDLADPVTISALVVSKPTMTDMARTVVAYGSRPAEKALKELEIAGDISAQTAAVSRRMLGNALAGFVKAGRDQASGSAIALTPASPDPGFAALCRRLARGPASQQDLTFLWEYLDAEGHTIEALVALAKDEPPYYSEGPIMSRLCSSRSQANDPGFKPVAETLDLQVDFYQQRVAARIVTDHDRALRR